MSEKPFVETETDRTKSKWVARTFKEFGRPKITVRALFYYAMNRKAADYPICGGFVGEIRIMRPYHESDGERLAKWVHKARDLGYIGKDAVLTEVPGENVFAMEAKGRKNGQPRLELWLNKSALNPLILPVCEKMGVTLVSVEERPSDKALDDLCLRSENPLEVLCLSDLSPRSIGFCRDIAEGISRACPGKDIKLRRIGLTPSQILKMKIYMPPGTVSAALSGAGADLKISSEEEARYKKYLKPYNLDARRVAELDALEVYYPGGLAGFVEAALADQSGGWLLDLKGEVKPGQYDVDKAGD
jgi:hypothetical protein